MIINQHFSINLVSAKERYRLLVVYPDGMWTSTEKSTLAECWKFIERVIEDWNNDSLEKALQDH
jgi:hypothetical protein